MSIDRTRVTVSGPGVSLKDGISYGATATALQIVGLLAKHASLVERRQAVTTALSIMRAHGYPIEVPAWAGGISIERSVS